MKKYLALLLSIMMMFQTVLPWNVTWAQAETTTATDIAPVVTEEVKPTATPTAEPATENTETPPTDPPAETTAATAEPTITPTAEPTQEPTAEPTTVPETKPTEKPTDVPTAEPTAVPTAKPTAVPTAKPTAAPTPAPLQVALNADATFTYAHADVTFTLTLAGGVAPYTIEWTATLNGDQQTQGQAADVKETSYYISYKPTTFGSHTVQATVTDAQGKQATVSAELIVAEHEGETEATWKESFASVTRTEDWRTDLAAIAQTQVGYAKSEKDFVLDADGNRHAYSRYGAWYGDAYADDWSAMFIAFCVRYAGIPEKDFPRDDSIKAMKKDLTAKDVLETGDAYVPSRGDVVFFKSGDAKVGIVTKVSDAKMDVIFVSPDGRVKKDEWEIHSRQVDSFVNMEKLMILAGKLEPTAAPTEEPTAEPTAVPTEEPTAEPTAAPTVEPTAEPTVEPTAEPTAEPTSEPTVEPTVEPTAEPTAEPTSEPTIEPTVEPTVEPTEEPTAEPTEEPTEVVNEAPANAASSEAGEAPVQEQVGTSTDMTANETPVDEPHVYSAMDGVVTATSETEGELIASVIGEDDPLYTESAAQFAMLMGESMSSMRMFDIEFVGQSGEGVEIALRLDADEFYGETLLAHLSEEEGWELLPFTKEKDGDSVILRFVPESFSPFAVIALRNSLIQTLPGARTTGVLPVTGISGSTEDDKAVYDPATGKYSAQVKINFAFTPGKDQTLSDIIDHNTNYTFKYPEEITIPDSLLGVKKDLYDDQNIQAGTYTFVKNDDGTYSVIVTFLQSYINNTANKHLSGYVSFGGIVDADAGEDGHIKVNVGNTDLTLDIPPTEITYPDSQTDRFDINVTKDGELTQDGSKIKYTVTVRSKDGTPDPIHFTDVISPNDVASKLGAPDVTVEKGTYQYWGPYNKIDNDNFTPVSGVTSEYNNGELTMDLPKLEPGVEKNMNGKYTECNYYRITYLYDISQLGNVNVSPKNTVNVTSTDNTTGQTVKGTGSSEVHINKDHSVKKEGKYEERDGRIKWTIVVNSNKSNIAGATLTDDMFDQIANGTNLEILPTIGYEKMENNGQLTGIRFTGETNTNEYTITYYTNVTDGWDSQMVKNKAVFDPDPSKDHDEVTSEKEVTVEGAGISKQNRNVAISDDKKTAEVEWKVRVTVPSTGLPAETVITDTMMGGDQWMTRNQITTWGGILNWGHNAGSETPYSPPTETITFLASDGNTYTYKQISEYQQSEGNSVNYDTLKYTVLSISFPNGLTPPDGKANTLTFTYKTTVDLTTATGGETQYINHVQMGDKSAEGHYTHKKPTIEKTDGNGGKGTTTVSSDGVLTWKVKVKMDDKKHEKLVVVDTLPEGVILDGINVDGWSGWNNIPLTINDDGSITGNNSDNSKHIQGEYDTEKRQITLTMTCTDAVNNPLQENGEYTFIYTCHVDKTKYPNLVSEETKLSFKNEASATVDGEPLGPVDQTQEWTYKEKVRVLKTDGNNQTGTTNSTAADGMLTWKVKATPAQDSTIMTVIDTLPKGVTLEGVTVNGNNADIGALTINENGTITGSNAQYSVSGTYTAETDTAGIKVTLNMTGVNGRLIAKENEYTFTFTCKADATGLEPNSTHAYRNEAKVTTNAGDLGTADQTQNWTYTKEYEKTLVLDKSAVWKNDNKRLEYSIVINPEGEDLLLDVETMTLTDVLTYPSFETLYNPTHDITMEASLVPSSVKLYKAVPDADGKMVKGDEVLGWSWTCEAKAANAYQNTSTLNVTGIPDSTPLIFEYVYVFDTNMQRGDVWTSSHGKISNTASLDGTEYEDKDDRENKDKWEHSTSSGGVTTEKSFTLYKVEKGKYNESIAGAEFTLYEFNATTGKYESTNQIYHTDNNGKLQIQWKDAYGFKYNTLYKVMETKAPTNYLLMDPVPEYYFYFSNDAGGTFTAPADWPSRAVDLSKNTHTVYAENIKNEFDLTVNKKWFDKNNADITHLTEGSISFDLYQATSNTPYKNGTVTIKATNLPESYNIRAGNAFKDGPIVKQYPVGTKVTYRLYYNWYGSYGGQDKDKIKKNGEAIATQTMVVNNQTVAYYDFEVDVAENNQFNLELYDPGSNGWKLEELSKQEPALAGTPKGSYTISSANGWTVKIPNLPRSKVKDDGSMEYYKYYVRETSTNGLTCTTEYVSGEDSVTIKNKTQTEKPSTTQVTVEKYWTDEEGKTIDPPKKPNDPTETVRISVQLWRRDMSTGEEKPIKTKRLPTDNQWKTVFSELPVNNNYVYYVKEVSETEGYTVIYDPANADNPTGAIAGGGTIKITNQKKPESYEFDVEKKWERVGGGTTAPEGVTEITVQLYKQVGTGDITPVTDKFVILKADNEWKAGFTELPLKEDGQYITYYVKETYSNDNFTVDYSPATMVDDETHGKLAKVRRNNVTITITNSEKISFTAAKAWTTVDNTNSAPADAVVKFKLYKQVGDNTTFDKVEEFTFQGDTWSKQFGPLPTNENGKHVTYYLHEVSCSVSGYTVEYPEGTTIEAEGIGTLAKVEGGNNVTITITNAEITPINVTVSKKWKAVDGSDTTGTSATLLLYQKKQGETSGTLYNPGNNEGTITLPYNEAWEYTFTHLPAVAEDGTPYVYYVVEESSDPADVTTTYKVGANGAETTTQSADVTSDANITVTNSEKISFNAEKAWERTDKSNSAPANAEVKFELYKQLGVNGELSKVQEITLSANAGWSKDFGPLPTRENGQTVTYYVKEAECTAPGFEVVYTGTTITDATLGTLVKVKNNNATVTITNREKPFEITVNKAWATENGAAPANASVTVKLYREGKTEPVATVTLPQDSADHQSWTYTFDHLAKTDNSGNAYTYYVVEESCTPAGYTATYKVGENGTLTTDKSEGVSANATITITNTKEDTVTIVVDKDWKKGDQVSDDFATNESVLVELYRSTGSAAGSKGTVEFYDTVQWNKQESWNSGASNINVKFSVDNDGHYHIEDTEQYPIGTEVTYTITAKVKSEYNLPTLTINGDLKTPTETDDPEGELYKIYTYTYKQDVKDKKNTINVSRTNGYNADWIVAVKKVDGPSTSTGEYVGTYTISKNNKWNIPWHLEIEGLPKKGPDKDGNTVEYTYEIREIAPNTVTATDTDKDGNITLTNTVTGTEPETTWVEVKKAWQDKNGNPITSTDSMPSVQVRLYQKVGTQSNLYKPNEAFVNPVTLSKDNQWSYLFNGLPKKVGNDVCTYYVEEVEIPNGYTVSYSTTAGVTEGEIIVTNSEKTNIKVNKLWERANGTNNAPANVEVTVELYQKVDDGEIQPVMENNVQKTVTLQAFDWEADFSLMPTVDSNGKKITYFVKENPAVPGFTVSYTNEDGEYGTVKGGTVTVTNTEETTSITVTKNWVGANGDYVIKDTDIAKLKLYRIATKDNAPVGDPEKVDEFTLPDKTAPEGQQWQHTFDKLLKAAADGTTYTYYVVEDPVDGFTVTYDPSVADDTSKSAAVDGSEGHNTITVTNTETVTTTFIPVEKKWLDVNGDENSSLGEGITVEVGLYKKVGENIAPYYKADGTHYTLTLAKDAEGKWTGKFVDLPLEEGDATITYLVKEMNVPSGFEVIYTTSTADGYGDVAALGDDEKPTVINNKAVAYELPKTGGPGTSNLYTVGGLMLMAAAVALLYNKKRREEGCKYQR